MRHTVPQGYVLLLLYLGDRVLRPFPSKDATGVPVNIFVTELFGPRHPVVPAGAFHKAAIDHKCPVFITSKQPNVIVLV